MWYFLLTFLACASFAEEPLLKGVLFVSEQSEVSPDGIELEGFSTANVPIPGGLLALNQTLSPKFIGKPLSQENLIELKREVILYYRKQGRPFVMVEIPKQSLRKKSVQLVVVEAKCGGVAIYGNKYFSTPFLKRYIRQKSGSVIDAHAIQRDLAFLNRNPFLEGTSVFSAAKEELSTDLAIVIKDRFPLQVYAGADNTGIDATGRTRLFIGFHYGNLFSLGHILDYQFTMSNDYHKFWAHTLSYSIPFPWRDVLSLYGGYSEIHPDIPSFRSTGRNTQASLRYEVPIGRQEFSTGFDFKNINSSLFFAEVAAPPISAHAVNITQLYFGYKGEVSGKKSTFTVQFEGFYSPGQWLPNQSNADFGQLHPGAVNHYLYGRIWMREIWKMPHGFSLLGQVRGQISTQNLISSEQFGLGGYNTVRGYEEREVNYDDAICLNMELHLPSFAVFRCKGECYLLGFFDFGTGRNVQGGVNKQKLISAGPGIRYKIARYLTLRLDWGFRLHKTEFTELGHKIHFGMIASF